MGTILPRKTLLMRLGRRSFVGCTNWCRAGKASWWTKCCTLRGNVCLEENEQKRDLSTEKKVRTSEPMPYLSIQEAAEDLKAGLMTPTELLAELFELLKEREPAIHAYTTLMREQAFN